MKLLAIFVCWCSLGLAVSQVSADTERESKSIAEFVQDLYSSDSTLVTRAKESLMKISQKSQENKSEIVGRLIEVIDDPKTGELTYSNAWYASAELLGNLRATEAIEALVRHLDYTDGVAGLSSSHMPAVRALARIGKSAVPALTVALSDPRSSIRERAAQTLGGIGGQEALAALESASKSETNKNVQFYIVKALQTAKN